MSQLHVITAYMNPVGWSSRLALYHAFESHMLHSGVHLTTVEVAYGEATFQLEGCRASQYIPIRAGSTPLWHKENALNIGIQSLPADATYVAWLDADITFLNQNWAADTIAALAIYDIVQPWTECLDLDANRQPMETHRAFCAAAQANEAIMQGPNLPERMKKFTKFAHPGYGWGAKRCTLDALQGLFEAGILGSGDHHMALACLGRVHDSVPWSISESYLRYLLTWQRRARACVRSLGAVPGVIEHGYHGAKKNRQYLDRWEILTNHAYNPEMDVVKGESGLLELVPEREELGIAISEYFKSRLEDGG